MLMLCLYSEPSEFLVTANTWYFLLIYYLELRLEVGSHRLWQN